MVTISRFGDLPLHSEKHGRSFQRLIGDGSSKKRWYVGVLVLALPPGEMSAFVGQQRPPLLALAVVVASAATTRDGAEMEQPC